MATNRNLGSENISPLQKDIFQEMSEKITQNFSELISLVNQRKLELNLKFALIHSSCFGISIL